jgi:SPFH domain / Band 7 family
VQGISELISSGVRWVVTFSPWPVHVRTTHRAIAFQHRFRFRLFPRFVFQLLSWQLAKWIVGYVPFARRKRSWCNTISLGPGIHWYWPKTTEIEVIPVERQTLDLPVQTLSTSDMQGVAIRAEVIFVVEDIRLAVCKTFDFQQTIQDVAQLAVVGVVAPKTYEELSTAMRCDGIVNELTEVLRDELRSYGVGVERAFLADFAKCTTLRVYGESLPGQLPPTALSEVTV